jgi:hypothetical protein
MDISKVGNFSPAQLSTSGKTQETGSFREIYQDQLTSISPMDAQQPIDAKQDLMDQGDRVLDLLDVYTAELGNPEKTLKDIDPLATAIEEEMNVFTSKWDDQPHVDEEMEGFAEALTITANVALVKFRRGDFI